MGYTKENPNMGSKSTTSINIDINDKRYNGEIIIHYSPDKFIMNNLALVNSVKALLEGFEQEEEVLTKICDSLVDILKPYELYATLDVNYIDEGYSVQVDYEFSKTGLSKLKGE